MPCFSDEKTEDVLKMLSDMKESKDTKKRPIQLLIFSEATVLGDPNVLKNFPTKSFA